MTFRWYHRAWRRDRSGSRHYDRSSLLDEARLVEMIALTERIIAIRPDQRDAWDSLVGALESGADAVRHASKASDGDASAPARMARLEICCAAGLDALRRLTAALDALYDQLDDRQKETLDLLATPAGRRDGHCARQAAG